MDRILDNNVKPSDEKFLKKSDYAFFCAAIFSTGALNGMVAGYLLVFYTSVLNISPIATGTMFLIAKIWDGINDPIMGVVVDRTKSKMGKMKPYLMYGAIPYGIVVISMFMPFKPLVEMAMGWKIAFMYVSYILYDMASTIVNIPLQGLPTVVSPNLDERNKLLTFSTMASSIGEQVSLVFVSIMFIITGDNLAVSYFVSAALIGILAPFFMIAASRRVVERVEQSTKQPSLWEGIKYMFVNKNFFMLVLSTILSLFRGLVTGTIVYYVLYVIGNGSLQIWFSLPLGISSFVGMMLVPFLKKRCDSRTIFFIGTLWYSIGLAAIWLFRIDNWQVLAISMFFIMAATGLLNISPNLMAADTIDDWENKTGLRQEGITFAVLSMRAKLSSGLHNFLFGFLLAYFMFSSPDSNIYQHAAYQFSYTKDGIYNIMFIIPAVLNLTTMIPLIFYKLNGTTLTTMRTELEAKRAAKLIVENPSEEVAS